MPAKQSPTPERPLWTYRELASHWGCHEMTLRRYVRQGRLKVLRLSTHIVRISDEERQRFEREAEGYTERPAPTRRYERRRREPAELQDRT